MSGSLFFVLFLFSMSTEGQISTKSYPVIHCVFQVFHCQLTIMTSPYSYSGIYSGTVVFNLIWLMYTIFGLCCWKSWVTVCEHKHHFLQFPVRTELWLLHLAPSIESDTWYPLGVQHRVLYKVPDFLCLILCVFLNS